MLLQTLYELSVRENLLPRMGYETKTVSFHARISKTGDLLSLRYDPKDLLVPVGEKRTSGIDPGYLIDNAKYVLGVGGERIEDASKEARRIERREELFQAFYRRVDAIAKATQDEGALALSLFSRKREAWTPTVLQHGFETKENVYPDKWSGSELVAVYLDKEKDPLFDRPPLAAYWSKEREAALVGPRLRCLITGKMTVPARLHPPIKRIPGGQPSGTSVVSFNDESFCSRGALQGDNAPVSRVAAEGYAAALNFLLQGDEERRFKYGVQVGENAVCLLWTKEKNGFAEQLRDLLDPKPSQLLSYAEAPWGKDAPRDWDDSLFYSVTVGSNTSRVVVRSWISTTIGAIKQNVLRYFADMQIGNTPRVIPLSYLMGSLAGPNSTASSELATAFWQAALEGTPFPREALQLAVQRLRIPPEKGKELSWLTHSVSVIKAVLRRRPRPNRKESTVLLDEDNTEVPYLLGRLFAVLERLQYAAQGDINATIRDRSFGGAVSTPAAVFPSLLTLSTHHAAKAENGDWYESLKGKITAHLPPKGFPKLLSVEDQGVMLIGYYHQREWFFRPKEAKNPVELKKEEKGAKKKEGTPPPTL